MLDNTFQNCAGPKTKTVDESTAGSSLLPSFIYQRQLRVLLNKVLMARKALQTRESLCEVLNNSLTEAVWSIRSSAFTEKPPGRIVVVEVLTVVGCKLVDLCAVGTVVDLCRAEASVS